jgi:ASC-1-like (ASCH) protein
MKLNEPSFEKLKQGTKTLEIRLYDEKRRIIKLCDIIKFQKMNDLADIVHVEVIGLLIYKKFEHIVDDTPTAWMGYPELKRDYLRTSMYEIYTKEDEEKFGVLGIRMKLVS